MPIRFGREICGDPYAAEAREWLVTNGIGGYASGTIAGMLTRHYHGLLIAALNPPVGRTLLLTKLDETVSYSQKRYPLFTNRWADNVIDPRGYLHIESFELDGTIPTWTFAIGDALLTKQVWMEQGENTTYIHYTLQRGSGPLNLAIKGLINYRDHHGGSVTGDWQVDAVTQGIRITPFPEAVPFFILSSANPLVRRQWHRNFELVLEQYRGLDDREDHLHVVDFDTTLAPGQSFTVVASTHATVDLNGLQALERQRQHEQTLRDRWQTAHPQVTAPEWIEQLVLAADQFIVSRPSSTNPEGKTIIAGYPWFSDWGRDTMISLPGLTLATGRPEVAHPILSTFAQYVSQGMLPNVFPDQGQEPAYNTVDATLWYFEAVWAYYTTTEDTAFLKELFPVLTEIIDWHCRGTRYNIHLDPNDGLLYAGEDGTQLTWMDAKIADWVVTPRIGKPIEVNALWYNALGVMIAIAQRLNQPDEAYQHLAQQTRSGFARFWNAELGYCYDVLDTPDGSHDASLRPNQIFAVALPQADLPIAPLLTLEQQQSVVDACGQALLTSHGLRSLAPDHPQYQGHYGGNQRQRDSAYHQGTVWGWLIGPFVQAHLRTYHNPELAQTLLAPIADHLLAHGLGSVSEIFDADVPMYPRGCIAQAWSVAEVLRAWWAIAQTIKKGN